MPNYLSGKQLEERRICRRW